MSQSSENWTFLSNHAHVLICLSAEPYSRARDLATRVGITERSVQRILRDLIAYGVLSVEKDGRRNRYDINREKPLRHAVEGHCTVGDLIRLASQP